MIRTTKEVYFEYCNSCSHLEKDEEEEPCCECLKIFSREDTHRPMYYDGDGTLMIPNTSLMPAFPFASERPSIPLFPAKPSKPNVSNNI